MAGEPLMRTVFRADASRDIGSGHVMRCASLAEEMMRAGDSVLFCCRALPGDMIGWLQDRGFAVQQIGADDAAQTRAASEGADWLVVDHYGLDAGWERQTRGNARLFALDDLGRSHDCDLLLDQNFANPLHARYAAGAPKDCALLLGPRFALVRPDFAARRDLSLARPRDAIIRLLVFMSGADVENETHKALAGIAASRHSAAAVDAVIGTSNLNRSAIAEACAALPNVRLHVQTPHMADLMTQADLMLCAGGSITWERCTLGVPALLTILADNQLPIAQSLAKAGAHRVLGWYNQLEASHYAAALDAVTGQDLIGMSGAAAAICDGRGIARVYEQLRNFKRISQ
jgi:UDP-2,4-diacetamido-2,4,6-trideoxy-beta-L-altropyranose hydrolase